MKNVKLLTLKSSADHVDKESFVVLTFESLMGR